MNTSTTAFTINAYNKNADNYAKKFMDFKSYKEKMILFQKKYIPAKSNIFDIGCGPGNNSKLLYDADNSYKISGIDLSPEMIALAKRNAPHCIFGVQDIQDIIPDRKYDAIIASFCIVHLSDEQTAVLIKKISKMLKDEGVLFLSFMEGKDPGFETTSFSDEKLFFNYFNRHMMSKLLTTNSIKPIEIIADNYEESDGSVTDDITIFAQKNGDWLGE